MADLKKSLADSEAIVKRAGEIEEELRRALPLNTDFAEGWQQRYLERQNQRYEKALEMARQEAAQVQDLPAGELTEPEWREAAAEDKAARGVKVCAACKGSGKGGSFQGGENDGGQSAQCVEHECAACSGSGIAGAEVDRTPVGPCGMFPCPPAAYCDQPGCLNQPAGDGESQAKAPQVPCPVCGGEAVHAQDVLARTTIAPVAERALNTTHVASQKQAAVTGNQRGVWCGWCDRIVGWRCESRDDAVLRGCPPKEEDEGDPYGR